MRRLPHLRWIVLTVLLLLPLLVYWPAIFHRYGLRDDYSMLRESHDEPGKVFRVCAMQARPIYGYLLEKSLGALRGIDDLKWLRLASALLLGAVAAAAFATLRAAKWERATALLVAASLPLLPGPQMFVTWTVAWPLGIALLLALGAFSCAERAFGGQGGERRLAWWCGALLLVALSALIYQPNTLFYFAAVAAAMWARRRHAPRALLEWGVRHVVTVGLGLGLAFTLMIVVFAAGLVPQSQRVALEPDWAGKLLWFLTEPLPNAFALTALADNEGARVAQRVALVVAIIVVGGVARDVQARGWRHGLAWAFGGVVLLGASFSVNLVAADRWPAYRVLFPLTAVVLVFFAMALLMLIRRRATRLVLFGCFGLSAWLARQQTFDLVAWPQGLELALLEHGAAAIKPEERPHVLVITPGPWDRVTERVYGDEFGSLSTDSDWTPKEMLKLALWERFGGRRELAAQHRFANGRKLPPNEKFDVVIDLRRLREFRGAKPGSMPRP